MRSRRRQPAGARPPGDAGEAGGTPSAGASRTGQAAGQAGTFEAAWADERTLLVRKTLRCGQEVRYPGNVVVLGDVNAGARVVAGGDVIVVGALRGLAHAGAMDTPGAVVYAHRLQATQLRIGPTVARSPDRPGGAPDADRRSAAQGPEIARLRDGMVVIEPFPAPPGGGG